MISKSEKERNKKLFENCERGRLFAIRYYEKAEILSFSFFFAYEREYGKIIILKSLNLKRTFPNIKKISLLGGIIFEN